MTRTLAVDQAVSQHNGQPFDALAITSNATSATAPMGDGIKPSSLKTCPKCTLTEVNVEVPQWATDVAGPSAPRCFSTPT